MPKGFARAPGLRRELAAALPRHGAHRLRARAAFTRSRWCSSPRCPSCKRHAVARRIHRYTRHHHLRAQLRLRAGHQARQHRASRPSWDSPACAPSAAAPSPSTRPTMRLSRTPSRKPDSSPRASCPATAWPRPPWRSASSTSDETLSSDTVDGERYHGQKEARKARRHPAARQRGLLRSSLPRPPGLGSDASGKALPGRARSARSASRARP